jgi:Protein of unknown function with HXXEE motif
VERRTQRAFVLLILAQAAHSLEEYVTRLYDVFPPARFLSSLFSDDLRTGFVIANVLLISFGLWCWAVPVRRGRPSALGLAWFWAVLELTNGTIHLGLAVVRGYFPGVLTAPLLIATGAWLSKCLSQQERPATLA